MYCYKCGEDNPENATYCKNCGALLKEEKTVKKVEVINDNQNSNKTYKSTTTSTSASDSSTLAGCCLCVIGIFIIGEKPCEKTG